MSALISKNGEVSTKIW